jgi:hypothetical protein
MMTRPMRLTSAAALVALLVTRAAHADTVADAITHLKARRPLLLTMASTQGTLQRGQAYWLLGGQIVASIAPLALMDIAFDAAEKFDSDLRDPGGYLAVAGSASALQTFLASQASLYLRTRAVATMLEEVAASGDIETAARVLRALYAYGHNSASLGDFATISDRFIRDSQNVTALNWSALQSAARMEIEWVIARRYWESPTETNLALLNSANDALMIPVLHEQMTSTTMWMCGVTTGWGGWIRALRSTITCPPSATAYLQEMSNHLAIVQGLAESYRLLARTNLLDSFPYYRDNAPWNLMASAAWTNYLAWQASTNGSPGCVFDRWASTGRSCDQTASGVEALQQVLRSFDVAAHMPY